MGWGKELLDSASSSPASYLTQLGLVFLIYKLDTIVPTSESAVGSRYATPRNAAKHTVSVQQMLAR